MAISLLILSCNETEMQLIYVTKHAELVSRYSTDEDGSLASSRTKVAALAECTL